MAYNHPESSHGYPPQYEYADTLTPDHAPAYDYDRTPSIEEPPEEYIVHVHSQAVAPVDEDGQITTHRALTANEVAMITLGGTLGTGLLVGTGTSLYEGGPLSVIAAFGFIGFICYCVMSSLCEMATYLPHKKGFVGYVSRYVHPAVGFGLGWTYLCQFLFVPASHINTAAQTVYYSAFTVDANGNPVAHFLAVPDAVWRLLFTIIVLAVNLLPIRGFGRLEFFLSTIKILLLTGLIVFGLVVDLGGARLERGGYDRIGFRYWGPPYGPLGHKIMDTTGTGTVNTLLQWWATLVYTLFSFMGIELIGTIVGETKNPRVSVPNAIKRTYRIIITLYIAGTIVIGLICPSNTPELNSSNSTLVTHDGQISPFTIAVYQLANKALSPLISGTIVLFALSAAASNVFTGSRLLYGMTLDKQAPQFLRKVTAGGRPVFALAACAVWSFLNYAGMSTANQAFPYFTDFTSTAGAIAWICILVAHIRFRGAMQAQRYPPAALRYISPVFPNGTYFALFFTIVFTLFKGYSSWVSSKKVGRVIVSYLLVVVFIVLTIFWKWLHNEKATPLTQINLLEEKREFDLEEERQEIIRARRPPGPWYQRLMSTIE